MNINSSLQKTPIAVIGLSAIFADAKNIEEYWENIISAKDSIKDVPANRWKIEDYYDEDFSAPDKTYCKRGGFLPEIDFNPMEFGLPPNILEVTDASQLLGLVAARDALEDAGYGQASAKFTTALKAKTGVLLGVGGGQKLITPLIARLQYPIWERALRASGIAESDIPNIVDKMKKAYVGWNENSFPGLLGNVISGRITNRFDLGGINSVVDAACAASLSAIKMSLSELVEGRCDMMLTGGVDTDNSPFMYMSFSKTPAFSRSGNISPFSDKADGMLIGEGLGMLVLKRLEDAERDGDRVYAVIKGVGTSSDGRFKSVYAPRSSGQALAMNRAYEDAGFKPATVGLLEAHGTGTGAGDPTEFASMQMVFGADNDQKQHIALGSVKSQIGHTKAAAGAAGMVKAVLALHHRVLPPTINVEQPNSKFDIKNTAIYINTESRPWIRNGHPRRAGVSAFGFGGINVHLALEEYQGNKSIDYRLHQPYKSILLQAATAEDLKLYCQIELEKLSDENREMSFSNLVKASKEIGIKQDQARVGFVIKDLDSCKEYLQICIQNLSSNKENWTDPRGIYFRHSSINVATDKVAALFAGQGAQYINMGVESVNAFPQMSASIEEVDQLFYSKGREALSKVMYPIPTFTIEEKSVDQITLTKTQFAQPAIGSLSMGQFKVFQEAGFQPAFCAGHSFGELTALWAAGVVDDKTFLALAESRGSAMGAIKPEEDSGAMLAVKESETEVAAQIQAIKGVGIANVNAKNQVVIGGSTEAIQQAEVKLKASGISFIRLPVSAAFHTKFVAHAQAPFAEFVARQNFGKAKVPVFANTTGEVYPTQVDKIKSILSNQLLNPVLFKKEIENLYAAGARVFVEFGPKGILTNLVKNVLEGKEHTAIAVNANAKKDSDLQLRQASVAMKVLGLPLNNIDPFKREITPLPAKSKMNVRLSGNNYVSKPTQDAYTNVLNDGIKISTAGQVVEKIVEVERIVEVEKIVKVQATNGLIDKNSEEEIMNKETLELLKATLESFKANQTKSLEIFERFMNEQNKQSQTILGILSSEISKDGKFSVSANPANGHHSSNGNGTTSPPALVKAPVKTQNIASQPSSPPVAVETPVKAQNIASQPSSQSTPPSSLTPLLLEVVSEKTGYPAEMLELNMDMEADLGIDSIKRVEIFAALTAKYPEMSGINPNELTELRTLGEIVEFVTGNAVGTVSTQVVVATPVKTPVKTQDIASQLASQPASPSTSSASPSTPSSSLTPLLLEVVSEKTGYPAEMLELSMDMEADLGIDSIKRVEIFAALTAKYPEMSGINPNELTELRTLGEIVEFVTGNAVGTVSTPVVVETPVKTQNIASQPTSVKTQDIASQLASPSTSSASPSAPSSSLTPLLLEVVSEKTGYPAEMLELNMDMEADLGIDSIKRVEIFAALTAKYPEMSGINPNELTELRTLGEIVTFVQAEQKKKELA